MGKTNATTSDVPLEIRPLHYEVDEYSRVTARSADGTPGAHGININTSYVESADYNVAVVSPAYATDGLILLFAARLVLWTYDDGESYEVTKVSGGRCASGAAQPNAAGAFTRITNVVFSPRYTEDNTVFVTGINLGLLVTRDGGLSYAVLFEKSCGDSLHGAFWTYYVEVQNSGSLSPDATDLTLAVTAGPIKSTGASMMPTTLHTSHDTGTSWRLAQPVGRTQFWKNVRLSPNFADDSTIMALNVSDWKFNNAVGALIVSVDAGDSWHPISNVAVGLLAYFEIVHTPTGTLEFVGGTSGNGAVVRGALDIDTLRLNTTVETGAVGVTTTRFLAHHGGADALPTPIRFCT